MPLASILVVDNDVTSRAQISAGLRELGHQVSETASAGSALAVMQTSRPDLLVCDYALPDLAGVDLLGDVRRNDELRSIRVIMTSARKQTDDIVAALESGADDFVSKPIDMAEFLARIDACLRRPASLHQSQILQSGGITADKSSHRVSVDGTTISLAPREYRLMLFLMANQDRVFSRQQLLVHVWDRDVAVGPRTVDVHIRRLRSLLERFGYDRYIQTVRGSGYRFSLSD